MSILNKIIKKDDEKKSKAAAKPKAAKKVAKPKAEKVARVKSGVVPMHYFEIIKRPYISEKAFSINSMGQYVFLVATGANKTEIKKAIEQAYKVKVSGVNITKAKPKPKKYKGYPSVRSGFTKAVVTLQKGSTMDIMEGVK
ncbi:MAG: 50S ribosomal protein L23 [Candidatus Pacebacteria bacterium]|jgi:large subunit ribosomal protein L23|nr:50S ribosomal protein L23 [Candidatus Paceibacterota bacterium]